VTAPETGTTKEANVWTQFVVKNLTMVLAIATVMTDILEKS
jgi:hypothetical protein